MSEKSIPPPCPALFIEIEKFFPVSINSMDKEAWKYLGFYFPNRKGKEEYELYRNNNPHTIDYIESDFQPSKHYTREVISPIEEDSSYIKNDQVISDKDSKQITSDVQDGPGDIKKDENNDKELALMELVTNPFNQQSMFARYMKRQ